LKTHSTFVKVRYAETDQMGVVYHGNYAQYLELGRIDWLSQLGISYKWMEDNGVMLPVYNLSISYKKSATFDDQLRIVTELRQTPSVRIIFDYKIYNQNDDLLTVASTELIFIDKDSNRPIKCPSYILELL
jgi:acyl-CoA thioester hydrolase|tara:strand:- start:35162 stop:35554 length:393 start_codon:yes stop_codon:yes gene_type:complete